MLPLLLLHDKCSFIVNIQSSLAGVYGQAASWDINVWLVCLVKVFWYYQTLKKSHVPHPLQENPQMFYQINFWTLARPFENLTLLLVKPIDVGMKRKLSSETQLKMIHQSITFKVWTLLQPTWGKNVGLIIIILLAKSSKLLFNVMIKCFFGQTMTLLGLIGPLLRKSLWKAWKI